MFSFFGSAPRPVDDRIRCTFVVQHVPASDGKVPGVLLDESSEAVKMVQRHDGAYEAEISLERGRETVFYRYALVGKDGVAEAVEPGVYRRLTTSESGIVEMRDELVVRDRWGGKDQKSSEPPEAVLRVANGALGKADPRVGELVALRAELRRMASLENARIDEQVARVTAQLEEQTTELAAELARVRGELRSAKSGGAAEAQLEAVRAAAHAEKATLERKLRDADREAHNLRLAVVAALAEASAAEAKLRKTLPEEEETPKTSEKSSNRRSSVGTAKAQHAMEMARLRRMLEEARMEAHDAQLARQAAEAERDAAMEEAAHARRLNIRSKYVDFEEGEEEEEVGRTHQKEYFEEGEETEGNENPRPKIDEEILSELEERLKKAEEMAGEELKSRQQLERKLHEVMGNIRVIARVRPPNECAGASPKVVRAAAAKSAVRAAPDGGSLNVDVTEDKATARDGRRHGVKMFRFDRVLGPLSGQEAVFSEVSGLVTGAMDGVDGTVLAYGQTGAGKTFTMNGTEENPGVVPRALRLVFAEKERREDSHDVRVKISVLEVYNDDLRDLVGGTDNLPIRMTSEGPMAPGLEEVEVDSVDAALRVMEQAAELRQTSATKMNETSSRSHLIVRVRISSEAVRDGTATSGILSLVDLAGSERVSRSQASGDRLKEARHINSSLAALGDVISALQQKLPHIPFRNSRLTMLLARGLGSGARVAMIAAISPQLEDVAESVCTLGFAERAASVELGKVRSRSDTAALARAKAQIKALQDQIQVLQDESSRSNFVGVSSSSSSSSATTSKSNFVGVSSSSSSLSATTSKTNFVGVSSSSSSTSKLPPPPSSTPRVSKRGMRPQSPIRTPSNCTPMERSLDWLGSNIPKPSSSSTSNNNTTSSSSIRRVKIRTPAEEEADRILAQKQAAAARRLEARRAAGRASRRNVRRRRDATVPPPQPPSTPLRSSLSTNQENPTSSSSRKTSTESDAIALFNNHLPKPVPGASPSIVARYPLPPSPDSDYDE